MKNLLAVGAAALAAASLPSAVVAQSAPVPAVVPTPSFFTLAPSPTPGPSTITVRLNVRVNTYAGVYADSGQNPGFVTSTASSATSLGSPQTNTKLTQYAFGEYARIYPGFDGIAANGMRYGAMLEIREDQSSPPGGGINGSISAQDRSRNTIFYRQQHMYVGADKLGYLRLGGAPGAATLLSTGTFENFNDGGWNGDVFVFFTTNTQVVWPFSTASSYYGTNKLTYVSPNFAGADFSISFEPSASNGTGSIGNCPYGVTANAGINGPISGGLAALGCDTASSTSTGDNARRRNTVEAFARYRAAVGAFGFAIAGGTIFSGRVADNATPARAVQFRDQLIGDGGLDVTYGGLTVGGHITGGRVNGSLNTLLPEGQRDEFVWLVGASYAYGPFIVGASYYDIMSAGSKTAATSPFVGNRNEYGVAAGGTYNFAPGMNIFLTYLYGHRKQLGVDFLSGAVSSGATQVTTHNNVQSQGFALGTQFRW